MKHQDIQAFAYKLFRYFCRKDLLEELEGDLEERFLQNIEKYGLKKAKRVYTLEVFKMLRPAVVAKPTSGPIYKTALVKSYITISLRGLRRQKLFSFINIFSLSVAMSSGLLVIGMLFDLLKFDEFHEHKNDVYRVVSTPYYNGQEYKAHASSPLYLGEELVKEVPGIQVTNLGRHFAQEGVVNGKKLSFKGIYADEHFFDFLSFELIKGSAGELIDPFNVLVTESFAAKAFQDLDPLGSILEVEGFGVFNIVGIVADPPRFSHIQFEVIASLNTIHSLEKQALIHPKHDDWAYLNSYYNYLLIPDEVQKATVISWLEHSSKRFYPEPDKRSVSFTLQPINEIIPGPNISDSIGPKMIYLPVIVLSIIAGAILLSAIFNYTNLSMARSLKRVREVGIRKLNGATAKSVYAQFTIEAVILSLLSLVIGIALFSLLRGHFIKLLPRAEEMVQLDLTPELIGWFVLFAIVTGLIAGLSPALFFSRLSSLNALRSGKILKTLSGINFRKGLIVAQFTLSIIFVLAVVIIDKQYRFALNFDLGFDKQNVLNVDMQDQDPSVLKAEFMKLPEVSEVSFSSYNLGVGTWNSLKLVDTRNQDSVWVHHLVINETYLSNMDLELIAGRNYRGDENLLRESSMIVNEQMVLEFGLGTPVEAIGQTFNVDGEQVEIIGVVRNFIYANLEEPIHPLLLRKRDAYRFANLKIASTDMLKTLEHVEAAWKTVDDQNPF